MTHFLAKVGNRTPDLRITSAPLCHLSYFGEKIAQFWTISKKKIEIKGKNSNSLEKYLTLFENRFILII